MKTHKCKSYGDFGAQGQTEYEFSHSTACGYVRKNVTHNDSKVTCRLCLREMDRELKK